MRSLYTIIPLSIAGLIFCIWLIKKGGSLLKSSVYGVFGLAAVNLASYFTGVGVGVNIITVLCTVVFGLPGVAMMLLLKLL
jgi:hypothetical protein